MSETDKEFVERVALDVQVRGDIYGFDRPRLATLARRGADAADEIERLKAELLERDAVWLPEKDAEIERLKAAIKQAIRQHEEGNKGLSHRTLCEAVYGPQA